MVIGESDDEEVKKVFTVKAESENAPIIFAEAVLNDFSAHRADDEWIINTHE